MIKNLVFSGAGVKIYCFLGFIKYLEEHDLLKNIKAIIGTSAGSIIATCICCNFSIEEIEQLLLKINITKLPKVDSESILNFFNNYGLDDASEFIRVFKIILKKKTNNENITFKELYDLTQKKLIISATNLNKMEIEFFDYINTPQCQVIDALIMSISIPLLFKPAKYKDYYYVDGGLTDNYPISYFESERKETLGMLVTSSSLHEFNVNNIEDYLVGLCMTSFNKLIKITINNYKKNTVVVYDNTNFVNFKLSDESKLNLLEAGYNNTKEFLSQLKIKRYYKLYS